MNSRPPYRKAVAVCDLQPGDHLADEVELGSAVLISPGVPLTAAMIARLVEYELSTVHIDIGHRFDQSVTGGRSLLQKAAEGVPITKADVCAVVEPLITIVHHDPNIARVLTQLQSMDDYTYQHSVVIGVLASVIGRWLGYDEESLVDLAVAGTLHDIGKAMVPEQILNKPGALSPSELVKIRLHPVYGYRIIAHGQEFNDEICTAALQHHERMDGSGYPRGLKGEEIHPYGRILAVADVYHAMTSKRSYKDRINPYQVLSHLGREIGRLDPAIVMNFTRHMLDYLMSCHVRLSDGRVGDVVYVDLNYVGAPLVKVHDDLIDLKQRCDLKITEVLP